MPINLPTAAELDPNKYRQEQIAQTSQITQQAQQQTIAQQARSPGANLADPATWVNNPQGYQQYIASSNQAAQLRAQSQLAVNRAMKLPSSTGGHGITPAQALALQQRAQETRYITSQGIRPSGAGFVYASGKPFEPTAPEQRVPQKFVGQVVVQNKTLAPETGGIENLSESQKVNVWQPFRDLATFGEGINKQWQERVVKPYTNILESPAGAAFVMGVNRKYTGTPLPLDFKKESTFITALPGETASFATKIPGGLNVMAANPAIIPAALSYAAVTQAQSFIEDPASYTFQFAATMYLGEKGIGAVKKGTGAFGGVEVYRPTKGMLAVTPYLKNPARGFVDIVFPTKIMSDRGTLPITTALYEGGRKGSISNKLSFGGKATERITGVVAKEGWIPNEAPVTTLPIMWNVLRQEAVSQRVSIGLQVQGRNIEVPVNIPYIKSLQQGSIRASVKVPDLSGVKTGVAGVGETVKTYVQYPVAKLSLMKYKRNYFTDITGPEVVAKLPGYERSVMGREGPALQFKYYTTKGIPEAKVPKYISNVERVMKVESPQSIPAFRQMFEAVDVAGTVKTQPRMSLTEAVSELDWLGGQRGAESFVNAIRGTPEKPTVVFGGVSTKILSQRYKPISDVDLLNPEPGKIGLNIVREDFPTQTYSRTGLLELPRATVKNEAVFVYEENMGDLLSKQETFKPEALNKVADIAATDIFRTPETMEFDWTPPKTVELEPGIHTISYGEQAANVLFRSNVLGISNKGKIGLTTKPGTIKATVDAMVTLRDIEAQTGKKFPALEQMYRERIGTYTEATMIKEVAPRVSDYGYSVKDLYGFTLQEGLKQRAQIRGETFTPKKGSLSIVKPDVSLGQYKKNVVATLPGIDLTLFERAGVRVEGTGAPNALKVFTAEYRLAEMVGRLKPTTIRNPFEYINENKIFAMRAKAGGTVGEGLLNKIKAEFPEHRVGGSFGQGVQTSYTRPFKDVDIYVPEKQVPRAKYVLNEYLRQELGSKAPKLDIHELAPVGADIGRYGIKVQKDIVVEGIRFMPISEQALRKVTQSMSLMKTEQGYAVGPGMIRGKDIADVIGAAENQLINMKTSYAPTKVKESLVRESKADIEKYMLSRKYLPESGRLHPYKQAIERLQEYKLSTDKSPYWKKPFSQEYTKFDLHDYVEGNVAPFADLFQQRPLGYETYATIRAGPQLIAFKEGGKAQLTPTELTLARKSIWSMIEWRAITNREGELQGNIQRGGRESVGFPKQTRYYQARRGIDMHIHPTVRGVPDLIISEADVRSGINLRPSQKIIFSGGEGLVWENAPQIKALSARKAEILGQQSFNFAEAGFNTLNFQGSFNVWRAKAFEVGAFVVMKSGAKVRKITDINFKTGEARWEPVEFKQPQNVPAQYQKDIFGEPIYKRIDLLKREVTTDQAKRFTEIKEATSEYPSVKKGKKVTDITKIPFPTTTYKKATREEATRDYLIGSSGKQPTTEKYTTPSQYGITTSVYPPAKTTYKPPTYPTPTPEKYPATKEVVIPQTYPTPTPGTTPDKYPIGNVPTPYKEIVTDVYKGSKITEGYKEGTITTTYKGIGIVGGGYGGGGNITQQYGEQGKVTKGGGTQEKIITGQKTITIPEVSKSTFAIPKTTTPIWSGLGFEVKRGVKRKKRRSVIGSQWLIKNPVPTIKDITNYNPRKYNVDTPAFGLRYTRKDYKIEYATGQKETLVLGKRLRLRA